MDISEWKCVDPDMPENDVASSRSDEESNRGSPEPTSAPPAEAESVTDVKSRPKRQRDDDVDEDAASRKRRRHLAQPETMWYCVSGDFAPASCALTNQLFSVNAVILPSQSSQKRACQILACVTFAATTVLSKSTAQLNFLETGPKRSVKSRLDE